MESLGFFGLAGFIMACILFERVKRIERLLREMLIRLDSVENIEAK